MKILFASDFHLGLTRTANHTAESSQRREQASREMLRQVLATPHDLAVCGGDFFDKFSNPETTIIEAMAFADPELDEDTPEVLRGGKPVTLKR